MRKFLIIIALILVFIYSAGGIAYYFINKKEKPVIINISEISSHDYALKSNATQLMKDEFKTLKTNLESNEIDDEAYAQSIAKLFIIDLYTLNNKLNKYDIGGTNYIFPAGIDNFKLNVKDTIYKYLEDNSDGKRQQELPEVKSVEITSLEDTQLKIDKIVYVGYKINLSWEYVINLDYDNEGEVIVIKDNGKYYIAEKK